MRYTKFIIASIVSIFAIMLSGLLQSCIFEGECDCPPSDFRVVFRWDSIGILHYSHPEMGVLFYPKDSQGWWRYDLRPTGGFVPVPGSVFRTISYNDNIETVVISGNNDYDSIQGNTVGGQILTTFPRDLVRAEPPVPDSEEAVNMCPTTMAVAQTGWFTYSATDTVQHLWPRLFTAHYEVTVGHVDSIASAQAVSVVLTGMSKGKFLASCRRMPGPVAYASPLSIDDDNSSFTGGFNTFGPATDATKNMLYVYVVLVDGEKKIYTFDVTDQIKPNANSLHVSLQVGDIRLPDVHPQGEVGSMQVGVSGWDVIHVSVSND